jgi:hypothetical protein
VAIGVFGETDRAWTGDALKPRGDIHPVAHEIAVALLDDVADMDADAKLDAPFGRHTSVALDETGLHLDGVPHGVDHTLRLASETREAIIIVDENVTARDWFLANYY